MLSVHPSPPLAASHTHKLTHTHTHTQTNTQTHTHTVAAHPAYPSMLKKYIFLFHFETRYELVLKAFSLLQSVHSSRSVVSDFASVRLQQPGLPVLHHLPKFAQVHVHCISDAIQSFHPLMPSSPPALNLSQHQGLFQ